MEGYGFDVVVEGDVVGTEQRTRELLQEQGFGVLTEIDVRSTLKQKLGADFRPYKILGACNPQLAHRALTSEPGVGLLLPCNVVVEEAEQGRTRVRFLDPVAALGLVGNQALADVAQEARRRLQAVAERLAASPQTPGVRQARP